MANRNRNERQVPPHDELTRELPPGVKLLHRLAAQQGQVQSLAFDPKRPSLASVGGGQTVKFWDIQKGKLFHTLSGYQGAVTSLTFDRYGEVLAVGNTTGAVQFWTPRGEKLVRAFELDAPVWCVMFNPQGSILFTVHDDYTV